MERKENDLMMNMVANPSYSLADFATIGFNINNTSLLDASVYKNNPFIQEKFSDENGKFNETAFNKAYQSAVIGYNLMASADFDANQAKIFHRFDISAPREMRREGPDFKLIVMSNPDRITNSIYRLGEEGPRTKSRDELAQSNLVLLNPAEVYKNGDADWSKAQWGDSPNDSFWGYFTDTLVLAQWDEAGTHIDPVTGQEVQHEKGQLKIGENGTYFYEKLDGRDIYGRQVLNKMNVLTTDGSKWNKYDFFDSDDIDLKSVGGNIMKNLALVGSMFIPYVGPWVVGASIATLLVGLMGTLGKMFTGSENPLFSEMEGWSKSLNRQTAKSEYAQEHTWCFENWINLVGDVAGLLKELRFFFEKVPALFKNGYVGSTKAYNKQLAKFKEAEKVLTETKVSELEKLVKTPLDKINFLKEAADYEKTTAIRALGKMDSWMKGYNKIGEIFSKGYMTAITVGDTYGEAKEAGASDLDATLLTLGYAAGEYAILNTGIGEWILPELRANRYKNQALLKAVTKLNKEAEDTWKKLGLNLKNIPKEGKKEWAKKVFNIGKNIAKAEYANGTRTLTATAAAGLGEGIEEVTEELLADFSKGCFNTVKWLQGEDTRMSSFGYSWDKDGNRTWNGKEIWDRYGMSFFGGLVGGALTNAGTTYRMGKSYANITSEQAMQEIIYMARNGELDSLYKTLDKMELANKHQSATEFEQIGEEFVPKPGTSENNRDVFVKRAVRLQLQQIDEILKSEGADFSDNRFLQGQTEILKDLKFNALHNAVTAGLFLEEYNKTAAKIVDLVLQINEKEEQILDTNNDGTTTDGEKRDGKTNKQTKKDVADLTKKLNEQRKILKDLVEGKRADEFVKITLYEMMTGMQRNPINYALYVKHVTGKTLQEITDEKRKAELANDYKKWIESDGKDRIATEAKIYNEIAEQASEVLKTQRNTYLNQSEEVKNVTKSLRELFNKANYYMNLDPDNALNIALDAIDNFTIGLNAFENKYHNQIQTIREWKDLEAERINTITDEQVKKQEFINLKNVVSEKLYNLIATEFNNFIQPFLDLGFANLDTKFELLQITKGIDDYYALKETLQMNNAIMPNDPNFIKYGDLRRLLRETEDKIKALNNTPVEENINQFAIAIGAEPINFTQLVEKLNNALNKVSHNVADFNMEDDTKKELLNAINLAQLYKQAINGAKTDNIDVLNPFGYNLTVNLVSKALGKDLDLAEVDTQYADLLIADVDNNLNKLEFLGHLYDINQGQKFSKLDRIGVKKDILLYKGLKNIVSVRDDELKDDINRLNSILEGLSTFKEIETDKNYSLDEETQLKFELEKIQMEDALYDFFLGKTQAQILKIIKAFDVYSLTNDLLNEELEEFDGPSLIWYLAQRAAVKSSDFYTAFNEILDDKIAPIPTLELAVYSNYASVINGDVIKDFFTAYRNHIKEDWASKTSDQRLIELAKLDKEETLADDLFKDYALNFLPSPRYSNVSLVEGSPGSGKTFSVIDMTVKMLRKHSGILDKVAVVHGGALSSADTLKNNLDIKTAKTFDHKTFCEELFEENNENTEVNEDNEIVSSIKLKNTTQPYSLIIIDEVSKFSVLEMDAINKYAKQHGITVIAAGDFDLTGVSADIPITIGTNKGNFILSLERNMFNRVPKLGVSMRTDNLLMSNAIINFRNWMYADNDGSNIITLQHVENGEGLFGCKDVNSLDEDEVKIEVERLIDSLTSEEKAEALKTDGVKPITYLYSDPDSETYKLLSNDVEITLYVEFKESSSAQGLEGKYYIVEATNMPDDSKELLTWKKNVYTGISRATQGCLIITDDLTPITTRPGSDLIKEPKGEEAIKRYTEKRRKILSQIVNGKVPEYKARSKEEPIGGSTTGTTTPLQTPSNPSGTNEIDTVINSLPDTIREDVRNAHDKAIALPRTKTIEPNLLENDSNNAYSYGDIIKFGNNKIGIIIGIGENPTNGERQYQILNTSIKENNTWGYQLITINKSGIKDVLYYKKSLKPHIVQTFTISASELAAKYGSKMLINGIDVEYDGRKARLDIVSVNHESIDPIGDIYKSNVNVLDINELKIILVKIGNHVQPFYYKNTNWKPFFGIELNNGKLGWINIGTESNPLYNDSNYYNNPLYKEIGKKLDQIFGNPRVPGNLGLSNLLEIANTINQSIEFDTISENGDKEQLRQNIQKAYQSTLDEWIGVSREINPSINSIILAENGVNNDVIIGSKLYTEDNILTITGFESINGNTVIYTSGNKTYSLNDVLSKINSGEWSLKPISKKTIDIEINGTTHTFKKKDVFYDSNGVKITITDIINDTIFLNDGRTLTKGLLLKTFREGNFVLTPPTHVPQIINSSDFNIDELDFDNNYYYIYEDTESKIKNVIKYGESTTGWNEQKIDENDFEESKEDVLDLLNESISDLNEYPEYDHFIIYEIPKSELDQLNQEIANIHIIPTKYIKTILKLKQKSDSPSETGEFDLNGIIVKAGDKVYDVNTNEEVEIISFVKNPSGQELVEIQKGSTTIWMSLDNFKNSFTKTIPVYNEDSINFNGTELKVGDYFNYRGYDVSIVAIEPYETGNPNVTIRTHDSNYNIPDQIFPYKKLLKALEKGEITFESNVPPINDIIFEGEPGLNEDNNVKSEEEKKSELDDFNSDPPVIIPNASQEGLNMLVFSALTNELGAREDANGNIIFDAESRDARIDGFNGLYRIDKLFHNDSTIKDAAHYKETLGLLRSYILNATDKTELLKTIQTLLGVNNLNIEFAYKASHLREDPNKPYLDNQRNAFEYHKDEKTIAEIGNDERSGEIRPHKIVALIKYKDNHILELPILTLNSPLTLARVVRNGRAVYPELKVYADAYADAYEAISLNKSLTLEEKHEMLRKEFKEMMDGLRSTSEQLYPDFRNLITLFDYDKNCLLPISDQNWLPSTHLKNMGSSFNSELGELDLEDGLNANYKDPENWVSIAKYSGNKQIHISPVLKARESTIYVKDVPYKNKVKPGHPFVLISFDPKLTNTNDKFVQWCKQQEPNYQGIKSVRLQYIYTPEVSLKEYIEQLLLMLFSNTKFDYLYGNITTPYRILKNVISNPEFLKLAKERLNSHYQSLIDDLNKIESELRKGEKSLMSLLTETVTIQVKTKVDENGVETLSETNIKLGTKLGRDLLTIMYDKLNPLRKSDTIKEDGLNLVQNILNLKKQRIYIWPKFQSEEGSFIVAQLEEGWKMNGKDCLINGKVDTYLFSGNLASLVKYFADIINNTPNSVEGLKSLNGYKGLNFNPNEQKREPKISKQYTEYWNVVDKLAKLNNPKINRALSNHASDYKDIISKYTATIYDLKRALTDVVFRLRNNGVLAFIKSDNTIVVPSNLNEISDWISDKYNEEIQSINVLDNNGNETYSDFRTINTIRVTTTSGNIINFIPNNVNGLLELVPPKSNTKTIILAPSILEITNALDIISIMEIDGNNVLEETYLDSIEQDIKNGTIATQEQLEEQLSIVYDEDSINLLKQINNPMVLKFVEYFEQLNPDEREEEDPDTCMFGPKIKLI